MINVGITKDGLPKGESPYGVCSLRVMVNNVLCAQCGRWIHSRCAGVKMVTENFSLKFASRKGGKDLILMMSLNETMYQLAMANSVRWQCSRLRMEDGHVLRVAL